MDEKNRFSNFDLQQVAQLPAEIAVFAEQQSTDIFNTANFWGNPNFPENYIPELIEIYYGNTIRSNGSDICILNGQLKDYQIHNFDSNIQSIAVQIDGRWAYIEVEGREILNKLSGVVLPDVVVEPSTLFNSVFKDENKVSHPRDRKISSPRKVSSISINIHPEFNQVEASQKFPEFNTSVESWQQELDALEQKLQQQQKIIYALNIQQAGEVTLNLCFDIGNMKQKFEQQKEKIELLKQGLEIIINCPSYTLKNSQLQNWVVSVEKKVKKTAKNSYDQTKAILTPKIETLKLQLEVQVKELKTKLKQQLKKLENGNEITN
ncbi:hypothetical protein ACF3DV_03605 [Chlorogloeopsis fritschii PCC 9212]|uniref:Uncharacterized protein n=1 Tax=Chlorogloeopsis fritschii PCC 6912 TaxID=211165 RepID=A0A3S0ZHJ3_CHLFR|nr:hypothetical protein [Chlorogloeopsis fritschii]RUR73046.1 hypothetical protein PCC6912_58930 [Chlorogloeopsis fritschii PCC 6912]